MTGPTTAQREGRQSPGPGRDQPPPPRRPRRPLVVLLVLGVSLALLAGGGAWVLYGSSWLRVQRVAVSGTRVLDAADVREAAAVPLGSPLVSVDTDALAARLRRVLPRIDTVAVDRSFPHDVRIRVSERTPVLVLVHGGRMTEVDADGTRFATVGHAPKGVPELRLDASSSPSLSRFGTARLLREAARVVRDLPAAVAHDTRTVKVRSYDLVLVELTRGRTVVWGSDELGAAKARTLVALMKAAPEARHFDVSAPSAPASSSS